MLAGAGGILAALACGLALRSHRVRMQAAQAALRSELESMLHANHTECAGQIAQFGESVSELAKSAQSLDAARGGITRSARSQAMQLLRSGMSPDNAAAAVGIGRREMHLLASVSRILTMK